MNYQALKLKYLYAVKPLFADIEAIERILAHYYLQEEKHYLSMDSPENHIFHSLLRLQQFRSRYEDATAMLLGLKDESGADFLPSKEELWDKVEPDKNADKPDLA